MSNSKSFDDSSSSLNSSRSTSTRSSYFQTELQCSCDAVVSDVESNVISRVVDLSLSGRSEKKRGLESSLKKKVSISVQADRSIVGKEDSLSSERKRWIRPPGVGQASGESNIVLPISLASMSSDSDEEVQLSLSHRTKSADFMIDTAVQNCKDVENLLEDSSDQSPQAMDINYFQRVPTPSSVSSVTSRPMEWDSGADVGYGQNIGPNQELSSIEIMALDQGRQRVLVRSDPEGKSCSKNLQVNSTVINVIGAPTSESTPFSSSNVQTSSKKMSSVEKKVVTSSKYQHLFPEVIIENKGNDSDSSSDVNFSRRKSVGDISSSPPKKSSSLENLINSRLPERQNATFPRCHSQINLSDELCSGSNPQIQKIINPPQSLSSSSIATVVTGSPQKISKSIQTSCHNNNAATQSSFASANNKVGKSRGFKQTDQNNSSTLESGQMSADDRVNSFEYLPGHMYENAQKQEDPKPWENVGISLRDDVERGVHLLEEFIQGSNANNTLMKKELIQRVVEKLIQSDYPDDGKSQDSVLLRCSTRRSQNRDEAIGESSSENPPPPRSKPIDNSTTLSGQSSSVWHSVTESSKSSDPSDPKRTYVKSVPTKKKEAEEGKKKPKSTTDCTSDIASDWKAPVTRSEKLYETKRKGGNVEGDEKLIEFLNSEREQQLDWIVKEIDHLSNLKSLLVKHQKLRRNLQRLKKERERKGENVENIIPVNRERLPGFRRKPPVGPDMHNMPRTFPLSSRSRPNNASIDEKAWDSHNYDTTDRLKLKKSVSTETRKEDIYGVRRSTAYTITFESTQKPQKAARTLSEKSLIADRQTLAKESRELVKETYSFPSLQDCLLAKRPEVVERAEMRRKTVAEVAAVRQLRQEKRPVVLAAALSSDRQLMPPPPPHLVKRVVSQKEMRKQTEKKYKQTFEVKKKVSERRLQEKLKTNRLMADVYNKRLQLLTLKGRTDLSNSIDVIYTV